MTKRTIQKSNGYSKKELIQIIEEIDAGKNQRIQQLYKSNRDKDKHSYSIKKTDI